MEKKIKHVQRTLQGEIFGKNDISSTAPAALHNDCLAFPKPAKESRCNINLINYSKGQQLLSARGKRCIINKYSLASWNFVKRRALENSVFFKEKQS